MGNTRTEDETEALLDKMSKDSFPASDPPQLMSTPVRRERDGEQESPQPAALARLALGEELDGDEPQQTLVLSGCDAVVLSVVAEGRRLQIALPCNPLEVDEADLAKVIAALERMRPRLRADPAT